MEEPQSEPLSCLFFSRQTKERQKTKTGGSLSDCPKVNELLFQLPMRLGVSGISKGGGTTPPGSAEGWTQAVVLELFYTNHHLESSVKTWTPNQGLEACDLRLGRASKHSSLTSSPGCFNCGSGGCRRMSTRTCFGPASRWLLRTLGFRTRAPKSHHEPLAITPGRKPNSYQWPTDLNSFTKGCHLHLQEHGEARASS